MSAPIPSKYEGCGEIGTLRSVFLAQFHPVQGPMIRCQWPKDFLSKEHFDRCSRFIIPKNEVQGQNITVNCLGYKISGYPTYLKDKDRYARNYLLFNLCFVCYPWSKTGQFEPLINKLSKFFANLERESGILSNDPEEGSKTTMLLENILRKVHDDLNSRGRTVIECDENSLQLKVLTLATDPPPVFDYQVPILISDTQMFQQEQWDLTTTQIIPFIDGFNHVSRISALSDVESALVRASVQNLVYHRVVGLVPMFQYSGVYTVTPDLELLRRDAKMRQDMMRSVVRDPAVHPEFRQVYSFIAGFTYGTTVKDLCVRHSPAKMGLDERRLVQYLVLRGILRRVHKYPVLSVDSSPSHRHGVYQWFTGGHHTDEISVKTGLSSAQLDDKIDKDPHVLVLWK